MSHVFFMIDKKISLIYLNKKFSEEYIYYFREGLELIINYNYKSKEI